jgi:hypothetical protein
VKSLHFIAILSCCLLAAAPHNFAQDRPQNPAATSKPADGLPPTEPFDPFLGNEADFEDLRSNDAQAELVLKVFTFQNIDATWAHQLICELFRGDLALRAVDQRSNALIVRGNTKILAEIEALLLRLDSVDTQETKSHSSSGIVQSRNVPVWKADNNPFSRLRNDSAETVGSLRDHYNELDAQCVTIARQIHKSEGKTTGQTKSQRTLERELDVAVGNAFRARQRLQRAELAAFQARTKQIGQSIELRDRIADQIIKRRVQQLLDPSVQWDNTLASHPSPAVKVRHRDTVSTRPTRRCRLQNAWRPTSLNAREYEPKSQVGGCSPAPRTAPNRNTWTSTPMRCNF